MTPLPRDPLLINIFFASVWITYYPFFVSGWISCLLVNPFFDSF